MLILPNDAKSKIYTDDKGKLALSAPEYSGFRTHTNYMSQNSYNYEYIEDEMAARRGNSIKDLNYEMVIVLVMILGMIVRKIESESNFHQDPDKIQVVINALLIA